MSPALTKEEEDFARWMDDLDLEEVNLLGEAQGLQAPAPDARERERLSGEREQLQAPKSRGVGWDEEP